MYHLELFFMSDVHILCIRASFNALDSSGGNLGSLLREYDDRN